MIKHRWYEVIVAWAEGEEIECKDIVYKDAQWGPWNEDEDGAGPVNWNNLTIYSVSSRRRSLWTI